MIEFIVSFLIGLLCIYMGYLNTKGNISTLHSYHRHRVLKKDILPFGKKVGLGTIIIGISVIIASVLSLIGTVINYKILIIISNIILLIGFIIGISICFYAMIKYNKGIF